MNNKEIETKIEEYIQGWSDFESFWNSHLKYLRAKGKSRLEYGIDYQFGEVIFINSVSHKGMLYSIDEYNHGYASGNENVWMNEWRNMKFPVKAWNWNNIDWSPVGGTSWPDSNSKGVIIIPLNKILSSKINFINWVNNNPFKK
jgi:hypothetical protein